MNIAVRGGGRRCRLSTHHDDSFSLLVDRGVTFSTETFFVNVVMVLARAVGGSQVVSVQGESRSGSSGVGVTVVDLLDPGQTTATREAGLTEEHGFLRGATWIRSTATPAEEVLVVLLERKKRRGNL